MGNSVSATEDDKRVLGLGSNATKACSTYKISQTTSSIRNLTLLDAQGQPLNPQLVPPVVVNTDGTLFYGGATYTLVSSS